MVAFNHFCSLLLWIHLLTFLQYVKSQSCSLETFKQSGLFDENFDLSNLAQTYNSGDNVRVHCKVGFRGFFKLICSKGTWFNRGDKCQAISCGHPGDVQFADFRLVKGTDYVFGSQVQYTCHRGYQMTSFTSTRNCLQQGWDGHLPECEPISCQPIQVENNVLVNGDMDQPQSGSVLQFRCNSGDFVLDGPSQIVCDEYGSWDGKPPTCKKLSCPKPQSDLFEVHGEKLEYGKDEVLRYSCIRRYRKEDGRPSVCKKVGQLAQWTPEPRCELIRCKLSSDPPEGTKYSPRNQIVFDPDQTVTVSCGDKHYVKSIELKSAELTCQETGRWDYEPVCQRVTCTRDAPNVERWQQRTSYYGPLTVYIDDTLWYRCGSGYEETSSRAKCVRGGWEPNPLCTEQRCPKPSYRNAEITDHYQKDKYDHNDLVNFRCTYEPTVTFYVYCNLGNWPQLRRQCKERPCTTQPQVVNGEMLDIEREQYEHSDRVQFRCTGETNPFLVYCDYGEWKTQKYCENIACTEQPTIKNGEIVGQPKSRYEHGDTVEMRCTAGSVPNFRVTCQSRRWISEHQCPELSTCGSADIENGYSYEHQNKLYYACNNGYKFLTKGWWREALCEEGKWKTEDCVASTDCGPVPDIPHMTAKSEIPSFSNGDTFPIHCETGHTIHRDVTNLTCTNGSWTSNKVPLNQICTPNEKKCSVPPKRKDAVIMAPFESEYPSGTRLTYKCRDNFFIDGDDTVQCINGVWDRKRIICKSRSSKPTVLPESQ